MTSTSESVLGIFKNSELSFSALKTLKNSGFRESDISLMLMTEPVHENLTSVPSVEMPTTVITYASTGAILGGIFGILSGVGFFVVANPVPYALLNSLIVLFAGVGIGGSAGALAGFLIGLGNINIKSEQQETGFENGGVLISIYGDNQEWLAKAKKLLSATGASNISVAKNIKFPAGLPTLEGIKFPIPEVIIPQVPHIVTANLSVHKN